MEQMELKMKIRKKMMRKTLNDLPKENYIQDP
jgi:hypothetical protein